nr:hypothetical protein [uncultured Endozoicomonas sp.]
MNIVVQLFTRPLETVAQQSYIDGRINRHESAAQQLFSGSRRVSNANPSRYHSCGANIQSSATEKPLNVAQQADQFVDRSISKVGEFLGKAAKASAGYLHNQIELTPELDYLLPGGRKFLLTLGWSLSIFQPVGSEHTDNHTSSSQDSQGARVKLLKARIYQCADGSYINKSKMCDGVPDCPGEDDENCTDEALAANGRRPCGDGTSYHESERCNLVDDCKTTGKDENDCSSKEYKVFTCYEDPRKESIPSEKRCNNKMDCYGYRVKVDVPTLALTESPTTRMPTTGVPTSGVPTTYVTTSDVTTSDVTTSDVTTSDVTTSDATTSDATTSDATTSDVTTSDATISDATTSDVTISDVPTTDVTTTGVPTTEASTKASVKASVNAVYVDVYEDELGCQDEDYKKNGFFQCTRYGEKVIIPDFLKCDYDPDCDNGFDEDNCPGMAKQSGKEISSDQQLQKKHFENGMFRCTSGEVIKSENRCNGESWSYHNRNGCADFSSHQNCTISEKLGHGHYLCKEAAGGQREIPASNVCDNFQHCPHNDDEDVSRCNDLSFTSKLGRDMKCPDSFKKITPSQYCDGSINCPGAEDEQGCTQEAYGKNGLFQCDDGVVVKGRNCDSFNSCKDKSDEFNCSGYELKKHGLLLCELPSGNHAPEAFACDGVPDCTNGEDELHCHEIPTQEMPETTATPGMICPPGFYSGSTSENIMTSSEPPAEMDGSTSGNDMCVVAACTGLSTQATVGLVCTAIVAAVGVGAFTFYTGKEYQRLRNDGDQAKMGTRRLIMKSAGNVASRPFTAFRQWIARPEVASNDEQMHLRADSGKNVARTSV